MARQHPEPVKTFSIGFEEAGFDELAHARDVARAIRHRSLRPRPASPTWFRIVEDLTWYLDEPFGDTSAIPTYMVSKLAAEHVKVVLCGDGGDEVFAGYDQYLVEQRERAYDRVPRAAAQDGRRGRRRAAGRHARPTVPAASGARRRHAAISTRR